LRAVRHHHGFETAKEAGDLSAPAHEQRLERFRCDQDEAAWILARLRLTVGPDIAVPAMDRQVQGFEQGL
jgi:hypothetical protein